MNNKTQKKTSAGAAQGPEREQAAASVLRSPDVLGKYYRQLFGTEDWGDAPGPGAYASGPVPKGAGSLAVTRLADPEARFHYAAMMAEVMLLPLCIACSAGERDTLNKEIAEIVGLDTAVQKGWIEGFTICWRRVYFPTSPSGLRVRTAPERRTRDQVLGSLQPHIRRFLKGAKTPPDNTIHILNGRIINL